MEFLQEFMVAVVIGICLCVGYILKTAIPSKKINKFIPLIVGVLGVVLNFWFNDFEFTPEILLGGLASGLASTGLYEMFKNFIENKKN